MIYNRLKSLNTLRPRQICRHCANDILEYILLNLNVRISLRIWLMFVPKVWIEIFQPGQCQIIIWTNDGLVYLRIYVSLSLNELTVLQKVSEKHYEDHVAGQFNPGIEDVCILSAMLPLIFIPVFRRPSVRAPMPRTQSCSNYNNACRIRRNSWRYEKQLTPKVHIFSPRLKNLSEFWALNQSIWDLQKLCSVFL